MVDEGPKRLVELVDWGIKGSYCDDNLISEGRSPIWGEEIVNLGLRFAAQTVELVLQGALRREESRGAHYREDFPDQNDENWRGHIQARRGPQDELQWT